MKRTALTLAIAALSMAAVSLPAQASSMPKGDFTRNNLGLGVGNGISVSLDFPVSSLFSLGGAFSAENFNRNTIDIRGVYKLVPGGGSRLTVGLLGGVQIYGPSFGAFSLFDPFLGVALAYPFAPRLTGRLNLAAAFNTGGAGFNGTRASGVELAYEFTPTLEGTLGVNGRGDILGLKLLF